MQRIGPIKVATGWGFLDESGYFAIPPIYEEMGEFAEGVASFKRDCRIGFVDASGAECITPQFSPIGGRMPHFSGGFCAVRNHERVGYIDRTGAWKISPQYGTGFDFVAGKAIVTDSGYHVIDSSGATLAKLPLSNIDAQPNWPPDWEIFVGQVWQLGEEFAIGVNARGEVVFPARFPRLTNFWEGVAAYTERDWDIDVLYGLVSLSGKIIKAPQFYNVQSFSEGLAKAGKTPTEFGYLDLSGEWAISPQFRQACSFRDGLACVTIAGRQGFINCRGELVVEPRFRRETSFRNGYAIVRADGKQLVINKVGTVIWEGDLPQ